MPIGSPPSHSGVATTSLAPSLNTTVENDIANSVALHRARLNRLAQREATRPENTKKQYKPKEDQFVAWCQQKSFVDGHTVTGAKLNLFLEEVVEATGNKRKKNTDGTAMPCAFSTFEAYVSAIVNLYKVQQALGENPNPSPRDMTVTTFLEMARKRESERRRTLKVDRARGTIFDGYTDVDRKNVSNFFMEANETHHLRNRCDFLIGHATLQRGDNKRMWQLADLMSLKLPSKEGPSECQAFILLMSQGKTNRFGKFEYAPFLRHKDVEFCPVGSLAVYLFARFHFNNEEFPNVAVEEEARTWYNTYLLVGKSPTTAMAYQTELDAMKGAFRACGISTSKYTHANRCSGAMAAEMAGASETSIRRLGGWNGGVMEDCYLRTFPLPAMRGQAGFPIEAGSFWIPRTSVQPPDELVSQVFPKIQSMQEAHAKLRNPDIAGQQWLKTMHKLAIVLLQDSVGLMEKFPDLFIWKHDVFKGPIYRNFSQQLRLSLAANTATPIEMQLQLAMPHLTEMLATNLRGIQESIQASNVSNDRHQTLTNQAIGKLNARCHDWSQRVLAAMDILANGPSASGSTSRTAVTSNESVEDRMLDETGLSGVDQAPTGTVWESEDVEHVPQTLDPDHIYEYKLNRKIKSVSDLWQEYTQGLAFHPAVKDLEAVYKSKWRHPPEEKVFFSRRKVIYDFIKSRAKSDETTQEEIVRKLESYRQINAFSLDALHKAIKKAKHDNIPIQLC